MRYETVSRSNISNVTKVSEVRFHDITLGHERDDETSLDLSSKSCISAGMTYQMMEDTINDGEYGVSVGI